MKTHYAHILTYIAISLSALALRAETITVENKTNQVIYVTPYYVPKDSKKKATRAADTVTIDAQQKGIAVRPPLALTNYLSIDRVLLLSTTPDEAQPMFSVADIKNKQTVAIGSLQGSTFYISTDNNKLVGYNEIMWKYINPFLQKASESIVNSTTAASDALVTLFISNQIKTWQEKNPYRDVNASVTVRLHDINDAEKSFIHTNAHTTKATIEKFTGQPVAQKMPRIALCFSGGGYRAMLYTLGALQGLQDIELLPAITYAAGLSGSTWAISPLLETGMELTPYIEQTIPRLQAQFFKPFVDAPLIINTIGKKYFFKEPITIIDIYGNMLINYLLKRSDLTLKTARNNFPYPIYTTVITRSKEQETQDAIYYKWMEFTPHEISSVDPNYLGSIPTWAVNRKFDNGQSINTVPPQNLGFFMGIWGSALAANINEMIESFFPNSSLTPADIIMKAILMNLMDQTSALIPIPLVNQQNIGATRINPAKINNFAYKLPSSARKDDETLTLIDAGIAFNLPLPPLLKPSRAVDIIIIVDASAGVAGAPELKKAAEYARANGLKFPPIPDYQQAGAQPVSVFADPHDPTVPTVIYFPRNGLDVNGRLPDYAGTFNFTYTPDQARHVITTAQNSIINAQQIIKDVVKTKMN